MKSFQAKSGLTKRAPGGQAGIVHARPSAGKASPLGAWTP